MSQQVDAVAECIARERELLQPTIRSSRDAIEGFLDLDFEEIGASGQLWSRQAIIEQLSAAQAPSTSEPPIGDDHMTGRRLADDLVLFDIRLGCIWTPGSPYVSMAAFRQHLPAPVSPGDPPALIAPPQLPAREDV